ncbi:hypothetical protein SAY86_032047 [Trapa natans]|uniref:Uncharacterized protein n=1 Tax=Trapa natans TaxID=22666 RepID=A0AAN7LTS8_TRANT|nr:hypothetical protein SAY86_032047 [Trapa natans]
MNLICSLSHSVNQRSRNQEKPSYQLSYNIKACQKVEFYQLSTANFLKIPKAEKSDSNPTRQIINEKKNEEIDTAQRRSWKKLEEGKGSWTCSLDPPRKLKWKRTPKLVYHANVADSHVRRAPTKGDFQRMDFLFVMLKRAKMKTSRRH